MKVLVACEESQEVCKAFRAKGHEAYSCDIQECSGGHPEWHIQGDALEILNPHYLEFPCGGDVYDMDGEYGVDFNTADGRYHYFAGRWDLIIAHPPCTFLSRAGASNPYQKWATEDYKRKWFNSRDAAAQFFLEFINADCDKIAVENPPGYMSTHFRKPDQIIHPYEHGHPVRKETALWLKGLPKLAPTCVVEKGEMTVWGRKNPKKVSVWYKTETRRGGNVSKNRSKTFPGIARAMAEQWG